MDSSLIIRGKKRTRWQEREGRVRVPERKEKMSTEKFYLVTAYVGVNGTQVVGLFSSAEEAEKAIIRDIKRGCWFGGVELEDVTDSDIEQSIGNYSIQELVSNTDYDYLGTELSIDGYPIC